MTFFFLFFSFRNELKNGSLTIKWSIDGKEWWQVGRCERWTISSGVFRVSPIKRYQCKQFQLKLNELIVDINTFTFPAEIKWWVIKTEPTVIRTSPAVSTTPKLRWIVMKMLKFEALSSSISVICKNSTHSGNTIFQVWNVSNWIVVRLISFLPLRTKILAEKHFSDHRWTVDGTSSCGCWFGSVWWREASPMFSLKKWKKEIEHLLPPSCKGYEDSGTLYVQIRGWRMSRVFPSPGSIR